MISIRNLNKSFDNTVLFKDYNLQINDSEFVVFSGVSGSGKTTLLNMIGAIESVDSGSILVDEVDITKRKNQMNYFRTKVGFLFQNFALIENKTVLENLKMIKKFSKNNLTIEEALSKVDLLDKINEKVYKLSGGQQQRIALARLMIKKCDLILADEPTGSLDKENSDKVISLLLKMNKEGKTIIMVSHDLNYQNIGNKIISL